MTLCIRGAVLLSVSICFPIFLCSPHIRLGRRSVVFAAHPSLSRVCARRRGHKKLRSSGCTLSIGLTRSCCTNAPPFGHPRPFHDNLWSLSSRVYVLRPLRYRVGCCLFRRNGWIVAVEEIVVYFISFYSILAVPGGVMCDTK